MAVTPKRRISDPMLVKPKCVLEASIYCHFSAVCLQFSKINAGLRNAFWLYQHGVRRAKFQSYSNLKREILIWVTLYLVDLRIPQKSWCHSTTASQLRIESNWDNAANHDFLSSIDGWYDCVLQNLKTAEFSDGPTWKKFFFWQK